MTRLMPRRLFTLNVGHESISAVPWRRGAHLALSAPTGPIIKGCQMLRALRVRGAPSPPARRGPTDTTGPLHNHSFLGCRILILDLCRAGLHTFCIYSRSAMKAVIIYSPSSCRSKPVWLNKRDIMSKHLFRSSKNDHKSHMISLCEEQTQIKTGYTRKYSEMCSFSSLCARSDQQWCHS